METKLVNISLYIYNYFLHFRSRQKKEVGYNDTTPEPLSYDEDQDASYSNSFGSNVDQKASIDRCFACTKST